MVKLRHKILSVILSLVLIMAGTFQYSFGLNTNVRAALGAGGILNGINIPDAIDGLSHEGTVSAAGNQITIAPAAGYTFSGDSVSAMVSGTGTIDSTATEGGQFSNSAAIVNGNIVITLGGDVTRVDGVANITVDGVTETQATYTLTAPTLTNGAVSFEKDGNTITTANFGDNISMRINPSAGYMINGSVNADEFNVIGGTKGEYSNGVLSITNVTGNVTVSLAGVTYVIVTASNEEYNAPQISVTGHVKILNNDNSINNNIRVDNNITTWAHKNENQPGGDDTISCGDTVIITLLAPGYTIEGTPHITLNNGNFPITGARNNYQVN